MIPTSGSLCAVSGLHHRLCELCPYSLLPDRLSTSAFPRNTRDMKPRDMGQFSFFLSKRRERAIALPSTQISTEISNIAAEKFEFSDTFPCNGGCLGLITRRPPVVTSYSVAVCLQCSVTTGFAFNINWSCNGSLGRQLAFATKQEGKLLLNCLFLPTFFLIWKLTALKTFFYLNSHHFEPLHFLAAFFFFLSFSRL